MLAVASDFAVLIAVIHLIYDKTQLHLLIKFLFCVFY